MGEKGRNKDGTFTKGSTEAGRPKGSKDKVTTEAKELMLSALEGQASAMQKKFEELQEESPVVYLNTLAKFLPYILPKKVENHIKVDDQDRPIGTWIRFKEE